MKSTGASDGGVQCAQLPVGRPGAMERRRDVEARGVDVRGGDRQHLAKGGVLVEDRDRRGCQLARAGESGGAFGLGPRGLRVALARLGERRLLAGGIGLRQGEAPGGDGHHEQDSGARQQPPQASIGTPLLLDLPLCGLAARLEELALGGV